jgi:hypothetical protein
MFRLVNPSFFLASLRAHSFAVKLESPRVPPIDLIKTFFSVHNSGLKSMFVKKKQSRVSKCRELFLACTTSVVETKKNTGRNYRKGTGDVKFIDVKWERLCLLSCPVRGCAKKFRSLGHAALDFPLACVPGRAGEEAGGTTGEDPGSPGEKYHR